MVRMRGVAQHNPSATYNPTADFLSNSPASLPSFRPSAGANDPYKFTGPGAGVKGVNTPEEDLWRRPYQQEGKTSISLYGRSATAWEKGKQPSRPGEPQVQVPEAPRFTGEVKQRSAWDGLMRNVGSFVDNFVSPILSPGSTGLREMQRSTQAWNDARDSDDPAIRQLQADWQKLVEDDVISAQQALGIFWDQYLSYEAQKYGESDILAESVRADVPGEGNNIILDTAGELLKPLMFLQQAAVRAVGEGPTGELVMDKGPIGWLRGGITKSQEMITGKEIEEDRVKAVMAADKEWLTKRAPALVEAREAFEAGDINDDEFRDLIVLGGFALTNPEPLGDDSKLNIPFTVMLEVVSDPLSIPAMIVTGGGYVGVKASTVATSSIFRAVGDDALRVAFKAAAQKGFTGTAKEFAETAAGMAARKGALDEFGEAIAREMKGALAEYGPDFSKGGERVAVAAGRRGDEFDLLQAAMRLADKGEYVDVVTTGLTKAGAIGSFAQKAMPIVRVGVAIDRAMDPFTLFGRGMGAMKARFALSNTLAEGFFDRLGWRTVRTLGDKMNRAGIGSTVVEQAQANAAVNHALQVGNRLNIRHIAHTAQFDPTANATDLAKKMMEGTGGDARRLMGDQVGRTNDFIVARKQGGGKAALKQWQEEAVQQLIDLGATPEAAARAVYGSGGVRTRAGGLISDAMTEKEMVALRQYYWGHHIGLIEQAKKAAVVVDEKRFGRDLINRVTMIGPRQMTDKIRLAVLDDVANKRVGRVRAAVNQYEVLDANISDDLADDELLVRVKEVLDGIKPGSLPSELTDKSILPQTLVDYMDDFGDRGYKLGLAPENPISVSKNADGTSITGVTAWVDQTVAGEDMVGRNQWKVGAAQSVYQTVFRSVSGTEIERAARNRFISYMADESGLTREESDRLLTALKKRGELEKTTPRGLKAGAMDEVVDAVLGKKKGTVARRSILDGVMWAYEGEMEVVGATQRLTGSLKKHAAVVDENWVGWLAENLYPKMRFTYNPIFWAQELLEYPYFMIMRGQYPIHAQIDKLSRGRALAGSQARREMYDQKTMFLMEHFDKHGTFSKADQMEYSNLTRLDARVSERIARRGRLGQAVYGATRKVGAVDLAGKKDAARAAVFRARLGDDFKRSLMDEAPHTWAAVRAYYPKHMTDGEVAVEWLFDAVARGNPDSVWSKMSPQMFKPEHLGKRAVVSPRLVGYVLTGDEDMTIKGLRKATGRKVIDVPGDKAKGIAEVSHYEPSPAALDAVESALRSAGADEDYIVRARAVLEFPEPDYFYRTVEETGIPSSQVRAWREADEKAAAKQGLGLQEFLSQRYAGAPLAIDQFGNSRGTALFQEIVDSLEARGLIAPERGSELLTRLTELANQRAVDWTQYDVAVRGRGKAELATGLPSVGELPPRVKKAREKYVAWTGARASREADPTIGLGPSAPDGTDFYRGTKHIFGNPSHEDWVRQLEEVIPDEAARRELADWYTDMQRGFLALFSDTPETQVEEAAKMIVAFGVTQLNTSPADGMQYLYRVLSMARRGEDWPAALGLPPAKAKIIRQASGGLNFQQLEELLMEGGGGVTVPEGLGQKLSDFIDSLMGKRTRSVGINGPDPARPWQPVAGDVWAKRDIGYLDEKLGDDIWRVIDGARTETVMKDGVPVTRGFSRSVPEKKMKDGKVVLNRKGEEVMTVRYEIEMEDGSTFVIPQEHVGSSVPTDVEYDRIVEYYNGLADYLNAENYLQRTWTAADVQAMGWFRAKRAFGDDTGDVRSALFKGRWTDGSELAVKAGTLARDLIPDGVYSDEVVAAITDALTYEIRRSAMDGAGVLSPRSAVHRTRGLYVASDGKVFDADLAEVLGDRSAAEQYLLRQAYLGKMDEAILIRDTNIGPFDYDNAGGAGAIGGLVRVQVESIEEAQKLVRALAEKPGLFPPRAHVTQMNDGTYAVQALWEPAEGVKRDKTTFNSKRGVPKKAVSAEVSDLLGREVEVWTGSAEFIKVSNDWSVNPNGEAYLDAIGRPSHVAKGEFPVPNPDAVNLARASMDELAGRTKDIIESIAARETAAARASAAFDGPLDPAATADDILAGTQFQRAAAGTRGAIRRAADGRRTQLFFNKPNVTADTLLHELSHEFAFTLEPSAIRRIKGVKAGLEGTTPGTRGRASQIMTRDDHEWFVSQYLLWAADENSVHPTMAPLMKAFRDDIAEARPVMEGVTAEALKPLQDRVARAQAAVDSMRPRARGNAALRRELKDAQVALAEAEKVSGLSPEMRTFFEEQAELAKRQTMPQRFDANEQMMLDQAMNATMRSHRYARDLIDFRGERSLLERSLNHPFFGLYPASYMWGKVLPNLVEFLMFRPFGVKAPMVGFNTTNRMYQSFMRQQEYDEEFRRYMYENEPAMRLLSMFIPGVPWDIPVNTPLWMRRIYEGHMTRELKRQQLIDKGKYTPEEIEDMLPEVDYAKIMADVMGYQFGPGRSIENFGDIIKAVPQLAEMVSKGGPGGNYESIGGKPGAESEGPFTPQPTVPGEATVPPPTAPQPTGTPPVGFAPETQVGPANVPTGLIESQVNEQVRALEQKLTEAMQP